MTTDYRALCAELLADYEEHLYRSVLADRARAALAQPEPEVVGPTDEELLSIAADCFAPVMVHYARAVLARWGRPAPTPAEGEVAWLIEFLRNFGDELMNEHGGVAEHNLLASAADLLEQRHPTPVPVAWMYKGEPDFDGKKWRENWLVTLDRRLAEHGAKPDNPISLFTARWGNHSADASKMVGQPAPPAGEHQAAPVPAEAEVEAVGPTDEELDALVNEHCWDPNEWIDYRPYARAVLARWGRPAPAPAEGEVAELVNWLLDEADQYDCIKQAPDVSRKLRRAADLLEQRHPAPVPVAERLPGPEDCDAEGRCWWGRSESDDWSADWTLATPEAIAEFCEFSPRLTWLPAHALPLPQGEVRP